jgi:16S rRNA G966 N2-methylase RsmD
MLMRYWGRKPLELIDKIMIDVHGTVIDPFGGGGTIVFSALRHDNKAIYLDINPYAWLVTFVNVVSIDPKEFEEKSKEVLENVYLESVFSLHNDYLYYPNSKFFWKRRNADRITEFFSRENFMKLFSILKSIDKVESETEVKIALYAAFCSSLFTSSRMKRRNSGSWGVPSYWVPKEHEEVNAEEAFKMSVKRFSSYFRRNKGYELNVDVKLLIGNALAFNYPDQSIVFTDPPYFDEIQYMELSFFYWAWLRESNFKKVIREVLGYEPEFRISDEIIVNPNRGATFDKYMETLKAFIIKVSKVNSKYLLFHYDNGKLREKVIKIVKENWTRIKVDDFEIVKQRKIGPRGGKKYLLVSSP